MDEIEYARFLKELDEMKGLEGEMNDAFYWLDQLTRQTESNMDFTIFRSEEQAKSIAERNQSVEKDGWHYEVDFHLEVHGYVVAIYDEEEQFVGYL